MSLEEKQSNAEKCIQIAESAMLTENYIKAKHMLLKAERIYPTDIAKQLIERIERLHLKNNENINQDENDIATAEKCITIARIAIANGKTDKAKKFLLKSINIHPLDEAKELFEKLKNGHDCNDRNSCKGTLLEAEECIEKAQDAFLQGNCRKALRLLIKSKRIYPTARTDNLLRQVNAQMIYNGENPEEILKEERKSSVRKAADVPPPQPKKREVTSEQINEIRRVQQAQDNYDILGIPKGSGFNEAKKAYKFLTKTLHPDKNKAPGAKDAFMVVKDAYTALKGQCNTRTG